MVITVFRVVKITVDVCNKLFKRRTTMIAFKILLIPIFLLIVFGLVQLGKFLFKVADEMEIEEKKKDIDHKADLVEDVDDYKLKNAGKIRKSGSDSVKDFVEN